MQKTAVITGVSSGIGRQTTMRFIERGYRVAGCARRQDRLEEMRRELGDVFLGVKADMTSVGDIDELFRKTQEAFGGVDILINNAGIGYETSLLDGDPTHWKEMVDLNIFGLAMCTRRALDLMRPIDRGHIINISSMSAHRVTPGGGMYAATKYAVRALTEGLRQELSAARSKIRVTAISPGFVETEFYNAYYHQMSESDKAKMFTEMKALQSDDIVNAVFYALDADPHVGINDILMRPLEQLS